MLPLLALAAAAQPLPVSYTLPEPVQTVEAAPEPAPNDAMAGMYRISKHKWTTDKQAYDRAKRAKLRRVLFHTLNAADLATTVYCLEARNDCREANPLYGQSTTRVVAGKVFSAVVFELLHDKEGGNEVSEWIAIGLLTAVVGNNIKVLF